MIIKYPTSNGLWVTNHGRSNKSASCWYVKARWCAGKSQFPVTRTRIADTPPRHYQGRGGSAPQASRQPVLPQSKPNYCKFYVTKKGNSILDPKSISYSLFPDVDACCICARASFHVRRLYRCLPFYILHLVSGLFFNLIISSRRLPSRWLVSFPSRSFQAKRRQQWTQAEDTSPASSKICATGERCW